MGSYGQRDLFLNLKHFSGGPSKFLSAHDLLGSSHSSMFFAQSFMINQGLVHTTDYRTWTDDPKTWLFELTGEGRRVLSAMEQNHYE